MQRDIHHPCPPLPTAPARPPPAPHTAAMLSRLGAFKFQYRVVMEPIIKWSLFFIAPCIISMADFKERSWESFASRRKGTDR